MPLDIIPPWLPIREKGSTGGPLVEATSAYIIGVEFRLSNRIREFEAHPEN